MSLGNGNKKKVVIMGCGFLGKAAALLFASRGWDVVGLARHAVVFEKTDCEKNISFFSCDITNPASVKSVAASIANSSLMIYAVSSGKGGADAYASIYVEGLERAIETWSPQKTLFVSSTSVYGQCHGEIVTESSPSNPERVTSQLLLKAEESALAAGGVVARFAGIYGPGRSVLLQKFLESTAVLEEGGTRWINQIHRDDGAEALWVLGTSPKASGIYIVSDDTPMTQRDLYSIMATHYKKPLPPEGPRDLNRKRGWTSKRLSNARLKNLGWQPAFPSYQDFLIS
ncbi:MAG: NAD-dependent epimerase/dehydratase family protein [Chthoniobacterales bacterium]|nr:NAD-dependent epimerase/dehydratase family protein [Chthoniobacterales bacterium]